VITEGVRNRGSSNAPEPRGRESCAEGVGRSPRVRQRPAGYGELLIFLHCLDKGDPVVVSPCHAQGSVLSQRSLAGREKGQGRPRVDLKEPYGGFRRSLACPHRRGHHAQRDARATSRSYPPNHGALMSINLRSGRSRPIEGSFRLTYGLFANGTHPVAPVSPPVGATLLGAYFEGDRRPIYSDRDACGRPLRLIYALCRTPVRSDRRDRRSSGITCSSSSLRCGLAHVYPPPQNLVRNGE
jgi:hypothetical protein